MRAVTINCESTWPGLSNKALKLQYIALPKETSEGVFVPALQAMLECEWSFVYT